MFVKMLMAPEGEIAGGTTETGLSPDPVGTPAATPVAASEPPKEDAPQVTTRSGQVIPMEKTTIDRLKKENQDKGRRAANADLAKRAKELGFDSVDDLLRVAAEKKKSSAPVRQERSNGKQAAAVPQKKEAAPVTEEPDQQAHAQRRIERRDREFQARIDEERRKRLAAQRKADEAQRTAWAAEASGELKIMALRAGVTDPDYAIELLTRELNQKRQTMNDEDYEKFQKSFNEASFFDGLKKTRAYLFQGTTVGATTGTTTGGGGNPSPPPPGAGKVIETVARAAQLDARKLSREEYTAELRRRGLQPPAV